MMIEPRYPDPIHALFLKLRERRIHRYMTKRECRDMARRLVGEARLGREGKLLLNPRQMSALQEVGS